MKNGFSDIQNIKPALPLHAPRKQNYLKENAAFTLIELLVVVLIIGILAAIAVPQYIKIVEKTKFSKIGAVISHIAKSIDRYQQINALDISTIAAYRFAESTQHNFDIKLNGKWTHDYTIYSHPNCLILDNPDIGICSIVFQGRDKPITFAIGRVNPPKRFAHTKDYVAYFEYSISKNEIRLTGHQNASEAARKEAWPGLAEGLGATYDFW